MLGNLAISGMAPAPTALAGETTTQTILTSDFKNSVKAITVAALPAYTRAGNRITADAVGALAAINGITLAANDSFYLNNGAAGADNGFWKVTQLGTGALPFILDRRDDADTSAKLTPRFAFQVEQGTAKGVYVNTNTAITLNTTAITIEGPGNPIVLTADAADIKPPATAASVGASTKAAPADHAHTPGLLATAKEAKTGAGAISVLTRSTNLTTDGAGNANTLADGTLDGQRKTIRAAAGYNGTNTSVITPANGTAVTFTAIGEEVEYEWDGTNWIIVGYTRLASNTEAGLQSATDKLAQEALNVFETTVLVGAAAVATLNATPVEIVPAPGALYFTEVLTAHFMLDYGTVGYDHVTAGDDLSLKYTDASGAKVVNDVAGATFGDATADALRVRKGIDVTPVANAAIMLCMAQGEWYAAAGDSTLRIRVLHRAKLIQL